MTTRLRKSNNNDVTEITECPQKNVFLIKDKEKVMKEDNKIINVAAKQILAEQGLFRKGNSRTWLEDNDYYLTIVEFQPSGYLKGSFLNVGINFLWESTSNLNNLLSYNFGGRIDFNRVQFSEYVGEEESFRLDMEMYSREALKKVIEYRQFQNLNYAKEQLRQQVESIPVDKQFWETYNLAILCFFKGDYEEGKKYFTLFMQFLENSFYCGGCYMEWHKQFYNYCTENILPYLKSKIDAQNMVFEMINRRRSYFCKQSAFKKMKQDMELFSINLRL